jgi:hypothetical protein
MNKTILFVLLQATWVTGFSQSLSLDKLGDTFQRTNLDVRWNAASNSLPPTVWIYRVLPKAFSGETVSNLVALGGFTDQNLVRSNSEEIVYKSEGRHPATQLAISHGGVEFQHKIIYGPTNLTQGVPEMPQILDLTSNYLAKFGIALSDIEKNTNGAPNYHFAELVTTYDLPQGTVTNVEYRLVRFNRAVDGGAVMGGGTCGDGEFDFGAHGKLVGIDLTWKDLKRYKSFAAAKPETIVAWIQQGKAVQGGIPMNLPPIDWATVKSLTVKKADVCYYAGERFAASGWLMPVLSLWATVDTGDSKVDVEIDCPVIDETLPK